MRKYCFLPKILMIWPYLVLLVPLFIFLFPDNGPVIMWYMRIYSMVTIPAVYLSNVAVICFLKNADPDELAVWNLRLKLVHIPFYLLGLSFSFAVMIFAPAIYILEWILMMTTSAYGIRATIQAGKLKRLTNVETGLLILGHCFFVTDVLCAGTLRKKLDTP